MRTIKFRGKSSYDHRWIIGALAPNGKRPCIAEFGKLFELTEVDYESVGQFTGVFDCNGKEIYEGDILGVPEDSDFLHEIVIFEDGCFSVEDDYTSVTLNTVDTQYRTIVGNIHDNPDML